jgi:hypothetical protein
MPEVPAPKCPLCLVNDRDWDSEPPGPRSYFAHCTECALLSGYREHSHTYRYSEAQLRKNPQYRADHTWRTSQTMRPVWDSGRHVGYRCAGGHHDGACSYLETFSAVDRQECATHPGMLRGVCRNFREHRFERGECDEHGYVTEFGEQEAKRRADAANRPLTGA